MICPRLSNPENLGAIARIGDVFGIDAILAGPSCPDPFSRRVLRVSMGSILRVPVFSDERYGEMVDDLARNDQLVLIAAVADPAAEPFDRGPGPIESAWSWARRTRGSSRNGWHRCGRIVTIPMRQGAGSLNVAVAAGILLQALTPRSFGPNRALVNLV